MRHTDLTACPGCGAPMTAVPAPDRHIVVTCQYCKHQVTIEPEPPAPLPVQPIAPFSTQPFPTQPLPDVTVQKPMASMVIGMAIFVAVMGTIPVFFLTGSSSCESCSKSLSSNPFPLVCGVNQNLVLDGKTSEINETLIVAKTNCKLTIKNCRLKGPWIIKTEHNPEIQIQGSTLEATKGVVSAGYNARIRIESSTLKAPGPVIEANANPKIHVGGKSSLKSNEVALQLQDNAEIEIEASTIEGVLQGIDGRSNTTVKILDGSLIKGGTAGVRLMYSPTISVVNGSRVESQGSALVGDSNGTITVRNSTVQGPKAALEFAHNTRLTLQSAKILGPRKLGTNATINEL